MLIERRIREEDSGLLKVEGITLLTIEEYEKAKEHIPRMVEWWWLRSPGYGKFHVANVLRNGSVRMDGHIIDNADGGIRPALLISNLDSFNLEPGDKILKYLGYDWTVISNDKILCDIGVGRYCFREDSDAKEANNYEKSDVKAWLENWAKERGIINAVL